METQRAIRRLKPEPVDDALVLRLIELALKAPTGGKAQGWEFIVVKDREVKERLARLNRQALRIYGGIGRIAMRKRPEMQRVLDAVQWQADHFAEIPVVVVACLRGIRIPVPPVAATSYYGSIYPAVQNLLLAARAAGLGAGPITLPLWSTCSHGGHSGCRGTSPRAPSFQWAGRGDGTGRRRAGRSGRSCTSTGTVTSRSGTGRAPARGSRLPPAVPSPRPCRRRRRHPAVSRATTGPTDLGRDPPAPPA